MKKRQERFGIQEQVVWALRLLHRIARKIVGIIFNSEILTILRPVVYLFFVMKHGNHSWLPIQASFAMDIVIIGLVLLKLQNNDKLRSIERKDLTNRSFWALVLYLLRDPIYENFTLKVLTKLFRLCRIPLIIQGILLSILNYQRYYSFIA